MNESIKFILVGHRTKERESELKHKFDQIKQSKLTRCKSANLYVKNVEDYIDDKCLRILPLGHNQGHKGGWLQQRLWLHLLYISSGS
ncbi:hypothetical protein GH733_013934 [Mirounga leonina]|nr:hypothetical protein GH733_013934 [Mirounga leonina]